MKLKIRLSLIVIAIVVVVIATLAFILLQKASSVQTATAKESLQRLTAEQAQIIKGRYDGYMRVTHAAAGIMNEYDEIPEEELRRPRLTFSLQAISDSEARIVGMFAAMKPGAIDSLARQYVGQLGATKEGHYAPWFTMRSGKREFLAFDEYDDVIARLSDKEQVSDPHPQRVQGKDTNMIRFTVPVKNRKTGEVVGAVGSNVDTAYLQPLVEAMIKEKEDIAVASVYTNNGTILASYVPERIGKNVREADVPLYSAYMNDVVNAIQSGKAYSLSERSTVLNDDVEMVLYPFELGESGVKWTIMIGTRMSVILSEVNEMRMFTVLVAVVSVLIASIIIFFVAVNIIKPILHVTTMLKDISEGEGDLTKRLNASSKDEIGMMSNFFNLTLDKIRNLVVTIKNQSVDLSNIGTELAANMTETAAAMNEISSNVESVKNQVINQSASVTETNSTMEQITQNINKLNEMIEAQTQSVTQSSSAVEEMLANIASVTQTLVKNEENVQELTAAADSGRNDLHAVVADIQEIAKESEGLLEINAMMQNVASQTNLLSMNAAIEAAHAGEAGKGFAVVADEIRKLAESSAEQSKTTSTVLKKIKDSVDKITVSTETVLKKFESIDTGVRTVADQETHIRHAMEEQSEGSKQVLEADTNLNDVTQKVRSGSEEMLLGSQQIIQESQNLGRISAEIANSMNEMTAGSQEITTAMNRVNDISGQNKESIATLVSEVGKFKVE
jgi:methyl-accepting chemotaxis protein